MPRAARTAVKAPEAKGRWETTAVAAAGDGLPACGSVAPCIVHAGRGFTANLDVNYRKPLPCAQRVVVHARIERVEGRKVYMAGCVTDQSGETKYAESKALFIVARKPGDQKATK